MGEEVEVGGGGEGLSIAYVLYNVSPTHTPLLSVVHAAAATPPVRLPMPPLFSVVHAAAATPPVRWCFGALQVSTLDSRMYVSINLYLFAMIHKSTWLIYFGIMF